MNAGKNKAAYTTTLVAGDRAWVVMQGASQALWQECRGENCAKSSIVTDGLNIPKSSDCEVKEIRNIDLSS